jgi:phospholipid/cholesterol/gamma-HCH transport system substrate-binding protein
MSRTFERVRTEPGLFRNTVVYLSLFVIAGIVGGIILANQRFTPPWEDRQVLYAEFPDTPGISPGNGQEVRVAGVIVGDISAANVTRDGKAVLELDLDRGHKIYKNAKLLLRPKSPLNEMYVEISPGGPPAELVPDGYQFPITNTQRPIQIDEVLDNLDDNARAALTSLLAESDVALTNTKQLLPGDLDAVRNIGNDLKPVAQQLALRKQKIAELITELAQIQVAIDHGYGNMTQLAHDFEATLHALGDHQPQIEQSLAALPGVVNNLKRSTDAIQDLSGQLDPTLRDLQRATDKLPHALHRFEDTADDLGDVVDAAKPFIRAARPVIRDLRPLADDLHEALPPLHGATEELDPLTRSLVPYLPDVAAFTVQTRSIVSSEDANEGILRGYAPLTASSLPGVFGPYNGLKPLPDPGTAEGTTQVQKLVPTGPGGQPAPPADGKSYPDTPRRPTPRSPDAPKGPKDDAHGGGSPLGGFSLPGGKH